MANVTSRVQGVYKRSDYPGTPDEGTQKDLNEFFAYIGSMFPGPGEPEITGAHGGLGIVARNPRLALQMLQTTVCAIDEGTWGGQHPGLRALTVQVVNLHFKCDLVFQAHLTVAQALGISLEQQAALPYWRTVAHMFSEDQRLVIEYTNAVIAGDVSDELFSRVVKKYGEKGAIECATVAGLWSCWAMILNATGTHFDFGYGPSTATK